MARTDEIRERWGPLLPPDIAYLLDRVSRLEAALLEAAEEYRDAAGRVESLANHEMIARWRDALDGVTDGGRG